jgi:hypothetical protein
MNKILLGLLALGLAETSSADAINSFTWDTFSSDDKMYVCNVGIIHEEGKSGHVNEYTRLFDNKDAPRYCKTRYTVAKAHGKSKKEYCRFTHHDLIGGIWRAKYSGKTGRNEKDCRGFNNYAPYKAESYDWITTKNT